MQKCTSDKIFGSKLRQYISGTFKCEHVGMEAVVLCVSQRSINFVLNSSIFVLKVRFFLMTSKVA